MSSLFAEIRRAHFAMNARLKAATGFYAAEYEVLRLIGDRPGIAPARLSEDTGVDLTSVCKILRKFEGQRPKGFEWVKRDPGTKFRGFVLTEEGVIARADMRDKALAIEQDIANLINRPLSVLLQDIAIMGRIDRTSSFIKDKAA